MTIAELAAKYEQYVIDMRREFHENPELSHHEERTVRRIREELDKLGIPNITVGHNNVIGTLEGGKPGKKIAIRADIDALPVAEANEVPYKSKVEGVMHACGHDGHAAMLLGTAHVLSEIRDQLCGTVYLCFQVAEEIGAGADADRCIPQEHRRRGSGHRHPSGGRRSRRCHQPARRPHDGRRPGL